MNHEPKNNQSPDESEQSEIQRLRDELSRERDLRLRALADFDNYRKRVERERETAAQSGKRGLILSLLNVMDDFDRALQHAEEAPESIVEGLRAIHRRFTETLQNQGVIPFTSAGQPFDPTRHEAIATVESDQHNPGEVLDELSRGWLWGGEVLRPARVRVAE